MGTEVDARSEWGADTTQLWKTNDQMVRTPFGDPLRANPHLGP